MASLRLSTVTWAVGRQVFRTVLIKNKNKTGTSQVRAQLKAKKTQVSKYAQNFFTENSRKSVETPKGARKMQNIRKIDPGTLRRHFKIFERKVSVPKQIERGTF